jgi:hypothetical protein
MGYFTNYKISVQGKPFSKKEQDEITVLKAQANMLKGQMKEVALAGIAEKEKRIIVDPEQLVKENIGYNPFDEQCKWYESDEDMKKISKKYPLTIFVLEGEGEESGDLWKKYFLNGKMQEAKAKITYDEFDEKKLK